MVTRIIILMALASASAFGELVVLQRGGEPITMRARCVDVTDYAQWLSWTKHGHPVPVEYPSLVDTDLKLLVVITGNYNQARADIQRMDDARRPAKTALKAALAGSTVKAKRKALRDAVDAAGTVATVRRAMRDLDAFRELVEAKRDEDVSLNITKEDAP
jgi:hypothetical protein